MQAEEYMQELLKGLSYSEHSPQPTRVGQFECLHARGARTYPVHSDVMINRTGSEVSLTYVQDYADMVKEFLLGRYKFLERVFSARIGIASIVSHKRISDEAKNYVESGIRKYAFRNVHTVPVLVDLKEGDVTAPKHVGFLLGYPLSKNVVFAREKFSVGGRLRIR